MLLASTAHPRPSVEVGGLLGSHPINLVVRFLLELAALFTMGAWGWSQTREWHRLLLALIIPLIAAVVWGVFAVPNDPSRSGAAPIPIPGILRLTIELAIFFFAVWALHDLGHLWLSWAVGTAVALHYIISYDRILWLTRQ